MHDAPSAMTHDHAVAVLKSYVLTYVRDRLGRDAPMQSRFLALDAVQTLEQERGNRG